MPHLQFVVKPDIAFFQAKIAKSMGPATGLASPAS
jgi:hypothetical protein